jgi:hypothetical protein
MPGIRTRISAEWRYQPLGAFRSARKRQRLQDEQVSATVGYFG